DLLREVLCLGPGFARSGDQRSDQHLALVPPREGHAPVVPTIHGQRSCRRLQAEVPHLAESFVLVVPIVIAITEESLGTRALLRPKGRGGEYGGKKNETHPHGLAPVRVPPVRQ